MLSLSGLDVHYGRAQVLSGIDLEVGRGQVVALLGRNGAGKSTLLKATMGLLRPSAGEIAFDGRDLRGWESYRICRSGLGYVPEDRRVFTRLTVADVWAGFDDAIAVASTRYHPDAILVVRGHQTGGGEWQFSNGPDGPWHNLDCNSFCDAAGVLVDLSPGGFVFDGNHYTKYIKNAEAAAPLGYGWGTNSPSTYLHRYNDPTLGTISVDADGTDTGNGEVADRANNAIINLIPNSRI